MFSQTNHLSKKVFCVLFGPYSLLNGEGPLTTLVKHLFEVRLTEAAHARSFCIPKDEFNGRVGSMGGNNLWFEPEYGHGDWTRIPLVLDR
jgi:hypothetical protein